MTVIKNNKIILSLNSKLYPLEAVLGAAYVFLDRAYIYLDGDPEKEISVHLKGKRELTKKELEDLANEFWNELLNYSLRYQISKNNKKIREYIVGAALLGTEALLGEEASSGSSEEILEEDWKKDPLGIGIPWEEKYLKGKSQKNEQK